MHYWVYIHTCPNGKKYVGCTKQARPELRWLKGNGYRYNKHFYSAILKHGWNNFEHEVFEVESEEEMYRKEVELISFYHSNDPRYGYNNSTGGEKSGLGCIRSEESRKKQSEARKGKSLGEEHRKHCIEATRKRCSDPEYGKHRSEIQKKKWSDPEYRRKQTEAMKGKSVSEEQRRKISETLKGRPGKPHSEETKRKISEANKKRCSDPEVRRKMSESHKGKSRSEEVRKHLSEIKKGKPQPKVKIQLPDGTIIEMSKQVLTRWYINKGKKFEYVD